MKKRTHIENLVALEALNNALSALEGDPPRVATTERRINALRKELPEEVLDIYDLRVSRGKKVVAPADGYVCRACYISIPSGNRPRLKANSDLFACGNCGTWLYLPETAVA